MAKKIGVQFATINRWENGHSQPTRLAGEGLFALCEDFNVPVYDMIIEKVKREVSSLKIEDGRVILYHGSKSGLVGDIAPISREKCDFGKGFYMGTTPEQPLTLICDFEESKFYVVSVDVSELTATEIPADIDWAMIVAYHRGRMERIKGSKFYNKYSTMISGKDLAVGSIANDRMFFVIDNFFLENITDIALVNSLKQSYQCKTKVEKPLRNLGFVFSKSLLCAYNYGTGIFANFHNNSGINDCIFAS